MTHKKKTITTTNESGTEKRNISRKWKLQQHTKQTLEWNVPVYKFIFHFSCNLCVFYPFPRNPLVWCNFELYKLNIQTNTKPKFIMQYKSPKFTHLMTAAILDIFQICNGTLDLQTWNDDCGMIAENCTHTHTVLDDKTGQKNHLKTFIGNCALSKRAFGHRAFGMIEIVHFQSVEQRKHSGKSAL